MKKKLLALVLACAMALGLAACGGSKAETPAGNNGDAANGNDGAPPGAGRRHAGL